MHRVSLQIQCLKFAPSQVCNLSNSPPPKHHSSKLGTRSHTPSPNLKFIHISLYKNQPIISRLCFQVTILPPHLSTGRLPWLYPPPCQVLLKNTKTCTFLSIRSMENLGKMNAVPSSILAW